MMITSRESMEREMSPLLHDELSARLKRIIAGKGRVEDLDRLFLGQRDRYYGKESLREIGDFVAHRGQRDKGLVTQTARDVFTSLDVWTLHARGRTFTLGDMTRAARANLRLATEKQLKTGCGVSRKKALRLLDAGLSKIDQQEEPTTEERKVAIYLGDTFIWRPAFTDEQLFDDFLFVALKNHLVTKGDIAASKQIKAFLALYAIVVMHGSSIRLENGHSAELLAGFSNKERQLEVKVQIVFNDGPKPISAPICMLWTGLKPEAVCEPELLEPSGEALPHVWRRPIEINEASRLAYVY